MKKWGVDCVPIIQQDLSHEETLVQIAFALDSLETVASNIFKHVHLNLGNGKARLDKIQRRCSIAEAKVKKITGIKKSLKVISTNKYPVETNDVFVYNHEPALVCQNDENITCRPLSPNKMNLKEKLQFFHVKDPSDVSLDFERYPEEGLGDIPKTITTVCSLYLFNTTENLFQKYRITDPLTQCMKPSVTQDIFKDKLQVEPAPKSIDSHFDWLNYRHDQDYFYSPSQNDVPDIEAPMDLPDLPGIAGDLQFSFDAPVESRKSQQQDEIRMVEKDENKKDNPPEIILEIPEAINNNILNSTEVVSLHESSNSQIVKPIPVPPPPPPAPPTPPPVFDDIINESSKKEQEGSSSSLPQPPDLRAHLMEAIRNAGGVSTLKPVSKKNEEKKPLNKSTGNSMMDELHNKLSWRRKGISGKFDSDSRNIMDRMVAMIPPPPSKPPDPDSDKEWDD